MHAQTIDAGIELGIERTIATGGASVSMVGRPVPTTGYMVGGYVDSLIFDSGILSPGNVAYRMVMKFVMTHFKLATNNSMFLGFWIDTEDNSVYIDLAQHVEDRAVAIHKAIENEEIAIWDLAKSEEIRIS